MGVGRNDDTHVYMQCLVGMFRPGEERVILRRVEMTIYLESVNDPCQLNEQSPSDILLGLNRSIV